MSCLVSRYARAVPLWQEVVSWERPLQSPLRSEEEGDGHWEDSVHRPSCDESTPRENLGTIGKITLQNLCYANN